MTAVYKTEYSAIRSLCPWTSRPGAGGEAGDGDRGKETMPADASILGHVTLVHAEEEVGVTQG